MIHLIWSTINILIFLYFLYLMIGFIVKGRKIFNPQFKVVSIFIMIIGVVQIVSGSNSEKKSNKIVITENYNREHQTEFKEIVLEDNLTFDISVSLEYSVAQNEFVPIESNSFLTGLVSGYEWEFRHIDFNTLTSNNKIAFVANGVLKWNLFGITVYSEIKRFTGVVE